MKIVKPEFVSIYEDERWGLSLHNLHISNNNSTVTNKKAYIVYLTNMDVSTKSVVSST